MKKNKKVQGNLGIILAIIFLVVIVVLTFTMLFSIKKSSSSNQQTTQKKQKLAEIKGDGYTFYYPESYVESKAKKDILGYTLAYQNPNSKLFIPEIILLKIQKNNKKLGDFNFKQCEGFAESNRKSTNEKIEVTVINNPIENGCEITSTQTVEGANDATVSREKWVWSKNPNDLFVYRVRGIYDANGSKDQADIINLSITAFMLDAY